MYPDDERLGGGIDDERAPGDSAEQRECEELIIRSVSKVTGCELRQLRVSLANGGHLEIDGCDDDRTVLCEAWAHQGRVRPAQKSKVVMDAAKLFLAGQVMGTDPRKILAFADSVPARWFRGRSWMAELLKAMRIEVVVVELPPEMRARICAAQERQYR